MQRFHWFSGILMLLLTAGVAIGQTADVAALKKQREDIDKQVKAKQKELSEARAAVGKSGDLAPLQKDVAAAQKAVAEKQNADADVKAARKAAEDAAKAREDAVQAAIAADSEGAALQKDVSAANAKIKEAQEAIKVAQKKLAEMRKKVDKDAKVVETGKAVKQAGDALSDATAKATASLRETVKKVQAALAAAVEQKNAADPKVSGLQKEIQDLMNADKELVKKIRDIENPPKPKAVPKPRAKK